uniref:Uncharacterized protein n=1 Tax=Cacopsylla melanoneura TaxID=428564 RepID=A0A8D8LWJ2_9HEMI
MDTDLGLRVNGSHPPKKCFPDPFELSQHLEKLDTSADASPNSSLPPEGSESPQFNAPKLASSYPGSTGNLLAGEELPSNEISAPYEVPQFPIEQIEKKLAIQQRMCQL